MPALHELGAGSALVASDWLSPYQRHAVDGKCCNTLCDLPDSKSDLHLIVLMRRSVLLRNQNDSAPLGSRGILIASVLGHALHVSGSRCGIRLQRSAIAKAAAAMAGPASGVVRRRPRHFEHISPLALQLGTAQAAAMHLLIRHIDGCFSGVAGGFAACSRAAVG